MSDLLSFSVIIPCRNGEKYLKETLDSVYRQTMKATEVIFIDDGSTDSSIEQVIRHPLPVKILRCDCKGSSTARNIGIQNSEAPLVAFLDSDDICHPRRFELQIKELANNSDAAMNFCAVSYIDAKSKPLGIDIRCGEYQKNGFFGLMLERNRIASTSTAVVRRSVLLQCGGFDANLSYNEEYDLWLRIASRWPISYLDEVLLSYRLHPEGVSNNSAMQESNERKALLKYSVEEVRRGVRETYKNLMDADTAYAQVLLRMGKTLEAEVVLLDLMKKGHEDSKTLFLTANLYLEKFEPKKAIPLYQRCLKLIPYRAEVINNLAVSMAYLGQTKESKLLFNQSIDINEHYSDPRNNLDILRRSGIRELRWTRQLLRENLKPVVTL